MPAEPGIPATRDSNDKGLARSSSRRSRSWATALISLIVCMVGVIAIFPQTPPPLNYTHWGLFARFGSIEKGYSTVDIIPGETADDWSIKLSLNVEGTKKESLSQALDLVFYSLITAPRQDGVACQEETGSSGEIGAACLSNLNETYSLIRIPLRWSRNCTVIRSEDCWGFDTSIAVRSHGNPFISANDAYLKAFVPEMPFYGHVSLPISREAEYTSGPYPYSRVGDSARFSTSNEGSSGVFIGNFPSSATSRDLRLLIVGTLAGIAATAFFDLVPALLGWLVGLLRWVIVLPSRMTNPRKPRS